MTPKEAAKTLNLEYTTVLHHLKAGHLTGHQDDRGRWQVDPESVTAYIQRHAPGQGRKPGPDTAHDSGKKAIFLGTEITPAQVARIRRLLPARLRAAVLLRLAELAEREPEKLNRILDDLGVEL